MRIPQDPFILCSFINMKLRNDYESLEDLCLHLQINRSDLLARLAAVGFEYRQDIKQFR